MITYRVQWVGDTWMRQGRYLLCGGWVPEIEVPGGEAILEFREVAELRLLGYTARGPGRVEILTGESYVFVRPTGDPDYFEVGHTAILEVFSVFSRTIREHFPEGAWVGLRRIDL